MVDFSGVSWEPEAVHSDGVPDELRAMMLDRGSLTARLKNIHKNDFHVQVLSHGWAVPTQDKQACLRCGDAQASIREVLLYGSGVPVVFARSILPGSSLRGENEALLALGNKSLGDYIFTQPRMVRGPIEITAMPARQFNTYLDFTYDQEVVWGRRSLFYLNDHPISVCEMFLPAPCSADTLV